MLGHSANNGIFGLMVLGLVATTLMFLTFAVTGLNLLEAADVSTTLEQASTPRTEEHQLRESRQRTVQVQAEQPTPSLAGKPDVEQLRRQIRDEAERAAALNRELADAGKVSIGRIYGAARGVKSVQYVECLDGAAVMRPQGTRFAQADLESLAKALSPGHVALLVRPGGFTTFLAVRETLSRKQDLKLGYLPVERDWQLDYTAPGE
jgi:hypothetical protein